MILSLLLVIRTRGQQRARALVEEAAETRPSGTMAIETANPSEEARRPAQCPLEFRWESRPSNGAK